MTNDHYDKLSSVVGIGMVVVSPGGEVVQVAPVWRLIITRRRKVSTRTLPADLSVYLPGTQEHLLSPLNTDLHQHLSERSTVIRSSQTETNTFLARL